ncbi:MAG: RNA methyltransferase [Alphaproteobacteria bacterium]|jgi:pimeloyl-ACP methyl ester carboxylesterase|nr:RNA methyltransferase [Alphaproteobacteria bacterium]
MVEATSVLAGLGGSPPTADAVERRSVAFPPIARPGPEGGPGRGPGRGLEADLYRPLDAPALASVVLVPGATPDGRDDARVIEFARRLTTARFVVLVPEIASIRELRIGPEDADVIADAVVHATRLDPARPRIPDASLDAQAVPERRVGLIAVSYAAGPAMLAAIRPALDDRIGFILLIGPYYDSTAAVTFVTTGAHRVPGEAGWQQRTSNRRAAWAFMLSNAEAVGDADDAAVLTAIARRRLDDPAASIDDLTPDLGPAGLSVLALVENRDPDQVPALLGALPDGVRARLAALDLAQQDLSAIDGPVLLMHGRDDAVIPYTESLALRDALAPDQGQLYLLDAFAHVDLATLGTRDTLTLLALIQAALVERDRIATAVSP